MKKISIITFIVILIDRMIKILIEKYLTFGVRNKIIKNFFYLTFCKNEGAAFSILSGKTMFLIFVTGIAVYILYKFIKSEKKLQKSDIICYGLLIGGIIGNFIDRILYGYVIDYLDFQIFGYNFAIFNFADVCIVLGAVIMLFTKGSEEDGGESSS